MADKHVIAKLPLVRFLIINSTRLHESEIQVQLRCFAKRGDPRVGVTQRRSCKDAMGLLRELSIALVFVILISTNVSGDQVSLTGKEFITYEPRKAGNPRRTEITLRFRTIHTNGLLVYSTGSGTRLVDFLQLDIHHGQVR